MLSRNAKAMFYGLVGPLLWANALRRRVFVPRPKLRRAHFGPGQRNYIPGWLNCDANVFSGKADMWVDLRNPLPIADGWLEAAYSHHVVEHLHAIEAHFKDVFRALKPGGVYRVAGPDADMAIDRYLARDIDWFANLPDDHRRIGTRFNTLLLCRGEHVALLTEDLLREMMENAGFADLRRVLPRHSNHAELFADVFPFEEPLREFPHTIVIEGVKPQAGAGASAGAGRAGAPLPFAAELPAEGARSYSGSPPSSSSNDTATSALALSRTASPSMSATSPSGMK